MANMRIHPGPFNNELLLLESEHRAYSLFYGHQDPQEMLDVRRGDQGLWRIVGHDIPEAVMTYIRRAGFEGVFKCGNKPIDHALITALVERWRPETHTFHLPIGEVTVTLQDVHLMWGLRTDGDVVTGRDRKWSLADKIDTCNRLLGIQPNEGNFKGSKVKMLFLRDELNTPFPDNPSNEQCMQKARLYILLLLGGSIFPDASDNVVHMNLLVLLEDFDRCGGLSWGSAALACLYRNLCKASKSGEKMIGGPMMLLQLWAWSRIRATSPQYDDQSLATPYGVELFASFPKRTNTQFIGVSDGLVCNDGWRVCVDSLRPIPTSSAGASNVIRAGMYFSSKQELTQATRGWHISQHRELAVLESTPTLWIAVCYTQNPRNTTPYPTPGAPCNWRVRVTKKNKQCLWQIKTWVAAHICYGTVIAHNNRSLKSSVIAAHIQHSIRANIAYPVKQIQADIKNNMHVDISYIKGWRARQKAIESIYGSWESNFEVLPRYIEALKSCNPNTIVEWSHDPNSSSSVNTFKYVFWAFGPAIEAFTRCIPVICVDGTHLKGSYKGKLLTAVTKDANNHILQLAYAIVDEETVDSWCWFFKQLRWYVANNNSRKLCVISDRHNGILHAMNTLEDWKEPIAYHRYCLRHIQSNFMRQFKSYRLKKLCYEMGCTSQKRKYLLALREIKEINNDAWEYLKEIGTSKWTLLYDANNRRWGNLKTNIAESFNNVLRGARVLPIKALIDFTFNKVVQHFRKHMEIASNCPMPLPPRMWKEFNKRDRYAQGHTVTEFGYTTDVYRVVSRMQNDYTIEYDKRTCTCGKWQIHRFPCSHGIAVCRVRGEDPHTLVHKVYTTVAYKRQYRSDFVPLPHVDLWNDPGWRIRAKASRLSTSTGRRRTRRIRNEMDVRDPNEPTVRRCGLCKQPGHNRTTCPNSHP